MEEVGIFLAGLLVFGLVIGIPILLLIVYATRGTFRSLLPGSIAWKRLSAS